MTKLLDLRKKSFDKVKVVEHIIFKPRSFKLEMIKMLSIIIVVTAIGFGVSSANDFVEKQTLQEVPAKNFSAIGIVSEVSNTSLTISPAKGPSYNESNSYTFDISNTTKILTNTSDTLSVTDINLGDKIIVQGFDKNGNIKINRIISFAPRFSDTVGNSSFMEPNIDLGQVITTTINVTTSTATTTAETSTTDATSTPSVIETITDTVDDIVEKAKETIQNVVDTVTGTTTKENKPAPEVVTPPTIETPLTTEVIPVVEPTPQNTPNPEETPTPESQSPPTDPVPLQ